MEAAAAASRPSSSPFTVTPARMVARELEPMRREATTGRAWSRRGRSGPWSGARRGRPMGAGLLADARRRRRVRRRRRWGPPRARATTSTPPPSDADVDTSTCTMTRAGGRDVLTHCTSWGGPRGANAAGAEEDERVIFLTTMHGDVDENELDDGAVFIDRRDDTVKACVAGGGGRWTTASRAIGAT
ncbi:hypothetical protein PR202_ga11092 [Eleusine coracana subsp. coracana]|uniref:Uncharacterized protein n=1 Tax=Eleusine coracana subsp. coracana TaxID=191504 RepID=A0AAV5C8S4_ELECO|nr:hypothetical protein PR202_ga11092 [Eleusine coracana subsp. coracana]